MVSEEANPSKVPLVSESEEINPSKVPLMSESEEANPSKVPLVSESEEAPIPSKASLVSGEVAGVDSIK